MDDEVERLLRLLGQDQAVMIEGADFMAFNYGNGEFAGGRDSIVSSARGHARVSKNGVWRFGETSHVRISEVTHFDHTRESSALTFSEVKSAIEEMLGVVSE